MKKRIIFLILVALSELSYSQSGSILATPSILKFTNSNYTQQTNLVWSVSNNQTPFDVTVATNDNSASWIGCTGYGSGNGTCPVNWIVGGNTYVFKLYANSQINPKLLSVTSVIGQLPSTGTIYTKNPIEEIDNFNSTKTINLTWTTSSFVTQSDITVSVNEGQEQWIGCVGNRKNSGSCEINWITANNSYKFRLYENPGTAQQKLLATANVESKLLTSSNNRCNTTIPAGATLTDNLLSSSGKIICLTHNKDYFIGSTLTIPSGTTLKTTLPGAKATIIDARTDQKKGPAIQVHASSKDVVIQDINLTGRKVSNASINDPNAVGIYVFGKNVKLIDLNIKSTPRAAIAAINNSDLTIDNVSMTDVDGIENIATPCIYLSQMSNVLVTNSTCIGDNRPVSIHGDADGGIAIYNSNNFRFFRNTVMYQGFYFVNSSNGIVSENLSDGAIDWPLDIVKTTRNVLFENNTLINSKWGGAVVSDAHQLTFRNNFFKGNNTRGYASCNGINLSTQDGVVTSSGIYYSQNNVFSGPLYCSM